MGWKLANKYKGDIYPLSFPQQITRMPWVGCVTFKLNNSRGKVSKRDLSKIWQVLSKYLVMYAVATWAVTQGSELDIGVTLKQTGYIAALFGFLICTPLYGVCLWLVGQYIQEYGGTSWYSKLPQIGLEDELDFKKPVGRMYQRLVFFFLVLVPLFAITHCYRKVLEAPIYEKISGTLVDTWCLVPISSLVSDAYRFGESGGVTFFPFYEPFIMTRALLIIWIYATLYFWKLFRGNVTT